MLVSTLLSLLDEDTKTTKRSYCWSTSDSWKGIAPMAPTLNTETIPKAFTAVYELAVARLT